MILEIQTHLSMIFSVILQPFLSAKFELSTEQGTYQGITETFVKAREFPQLTLDFYVDSQYQVIRMFEEWMNFINPYTTQGYADAGSTGGSTYSTPNLETNNYYRFRYPNTYKRSISVTKFERNYPLTTSDSSAKTRSWCSCN